VSTACFTSFSFGYLARARVLAQTLKAAHPDWELWALLVDEAPAGVDLAAALADFDQVMPASALPIADFPGWLFRHDIVEACTAVKGTMLEFLLARGAGRVVYLDPDIAVFHALEPVERAFADHSIVLTPHQTAANANPAAMRDNELTSMQYGIYNLGFLGVRNDADGRAFAAWWAAATRRACYDDVSAGLFTDQKYCDLVPGLFGGVRVERDAGCNVASWNLSTRRLRFAPDGSVFANGERLRFYHFTKIDGVGDTMTERYAGANSEVYELVNWYRRRVRANGSALAARPWHYGQFADGTPISRAVRLLWRVKTDLWPEFADPFAAGEGSFLAWIRHNTPSLLTA
jgi:hypothetical protein